MPFRRLFETQSSDSGYDFEITDGSTIPKSIILNKGDKYYGKQKCREIRRSRIS